MHAGWLAGWRARRRLSWAGISTIYVHLAPTTASFENFINTEPICISLFIFIRKGVTGRARNEKQNIQREKASGTVIAPA